MSSEAPPLRVENYVVYRFNVKIVFPARKFVEFYVATVLRIGGYTYMVDAHKETIMVAKSLAAVVPPEDLEPLSRLARRLLQLAMAYRDASDSESVRPNGFKTAGNVATFEICDAEVLGVRAAKDRLPKLLNDVSDGQVAFVEAGKGGTVAMIRADVLTDIISSLDGHSAATLGDAFRAASSGEPLAWSLPAGHSLSRGLLQI